MDFAQENPELSVDQMSHTSDSEGYYDCSPDVSCVVKTVKTLSKWHNVLAHQNIQYIKQLLKSKNISFTDDEKDFVCLKCLSGKPHRMPHPLSNSRASKTLELVHADVCGPMETSSIGGARYFLVFKDDLTCYRTVYFMKNKSEVKALLSKFISMAERETNNKMKVLRIDNGLEFINKEITELLEKQGIQHQRSVPYTPQQNGRAEREMRILVEAARSVKRRSFGQKQSILQPIL